MKPPASSLLLLLFFWFGFVGCKGLFHPHHPLSTTITRREAIFEGGKDETPATCIQKMYGTSGFTRAVLFFSHARGSTRALQCCWGILMQVTKQTRLCSRGQPCERFTRGHTESGKTRESTVQVLMSRHLVHPRGMSSRASSFRIEGFV